MGEGDGEVTINVQIAGLEKLMQEGFKRVDQRQEDMIRVMGGMVSAEAFSLWCQRIERNEKDIETNDHRLDRVESMLSMVTRGLTIVGGMLLTLITGILLALATGQLHIGVGPTP